MQIFIDTQSIYDQFNYTPEEINELMDETVKEITNRFATEWQNEANRTLKSSRQEYINNIVVVDEGFAKGAVVLTGWLPNAVEQGLESFDMKEGALNGPNAKVGKNGSKYNTIPFSIGAPDSLGENFNGGVMPKQIHDVVKNKQVDSITKKSAPLKENEIPKPFDQPKTKSIKLPESKSAKQYVHKGSIYEGIAKQKDSAGNTSYKSFRRISENSDPSAFIHPGIEAANLADKVLSDFDVPAEMSIVLDKLLK